ncbi:MAG: hypothetical protein QOC69_2704 [Mycobacterium sp.]|nr:hypothetical protein [Mycobacterium sp.]
MPAPPAPAHRSSRHAPTGARDRPPCDATPREGPGTDTSHTTPHADPPNTPHLQCGATCSRAYHGPYEATPTNSPPHAVHQPRSPAAKANGPHGAHSWNFSWPASVPPRVGQPLSVGADRNLVTRGCGTGSLPFPRHCARATTVRSNGLRCGRRRVVAQQVPAPSQHDHAERGKAEHRRGDQRRPWAEQLRAKTDGGHADG